MPEPELLKSLHRHTPQLITQFYIILRYPLLVTWRYTLVFSRLKKRVTIAATCRELTILEIQCLRDHQHQQVRGNVKVDGRWQGRAALSAKYPTSLGLAWGYVISLVVSRIARGGIPRAVQQRGELLLDSARHEECCVLVLEALASGSMQTVPAKYAG